MKYLFRLITLCALICSGLHAHSQKQSFKSTETKKDSLKNIYVTGSYGILFQYMPTGHENKDYKIGLRPSILVNFTLNTHIDFSKYIGIMQGCAIKNVGFKTLDETIESVEYDKIIRRSYMAEAYAAIKIGALQKFTFFYIGAGYGFSTHYRQKQVEHNRKIIDSQWFSSATKQFVPSIVAGYQFSNNIHVQLQYFLSDFLNHSYNNKFGDFSKFDNTQILQLSLSFQKKDTDSKNTLKNLEDNKLIAL
ncbi:MAG: hypothetical protein R6U95_00395 [Bacteroidales bacterium]